MREESVRLGKNPASLLGFLKVGARSCARPPIDIFQSIRDAGVPSGHRSSYRISHSRRRCTGGGDSHSDEPAFIIDWLIYMLLSVSAISLPAPLSLSLSISLFLFLSFQLCRFIISPSGHYSADPLTPIGTAICLCLALMIFSQFGKFVSNRMLRLWTL